MQIYKTSCHMVTDKIYKIGNKTQHRSQISKTCSYIRGASNYKPDSINEYR